MVATILIMTRVTRWPTFVSCGTWAPSFNRERKNHQSPNSLWSWALRLFLIHFHAILPLLLVLLSPKFPCFPTTFGWVFVGFAVFWLPHMHHRNFIRQQLLRKQAWGRNSSSSCGRRRRRRRRRIWQHDLLLGYGCNWSLHRLGSEILLIGGLVHGVLCDGV